MNSQLLSSNSISLANIDKFEKTSLSNLCSSKTELSKTEIILEACTATEQRILIWLKERDITMAIPEEKEFAYFERKRLNAYQGSPLSKKGIILNKSEIFSDSPLMQRRRNSLQDLKDPEKRRVSCVKMSIFKTSNFAAMLLNEQEGE